MTKKFLPIVIVVAAVLAGWLVYRSMSGGPEPLASEIAAKLDISEISLQGEVLTVVGDYVVVRAGRVQRTDQGNVVVMYDRVILFTDEAKEESLAKLKVGESAVFYGTGTDNPQSKEEFVANRVEVISR